MKNRVLRSALAVILVIAMVLTMAACNNTDPVETTAPVVTSAPAATTTPTDAPVATVTPTEAPAVEVVDDVEAQLNEYGITFPEFDLTYSATAADSSSFDVDDMAFGLKVDTDNDYQNAYTFTISAKISATTLDGSSLSKSKYTHETYGVVGSTSTGYVNAGDSLDWTAGNSKFYMVPGVTGIYTVTYTIEVEHDKDYSYGYYTPGEVDEKYTITKTYTVEKAKLELKTSDDAFQVEDSMFFADATVPKQNTFDGLVDGDYSISVDVTSCTGTEVGEYTLAITITDKDDNVVDPSDITLDNYYLVVTEGTRYILSKEDVAKANAVRKMYYDDKTVGVTTEYSQETITYYNTLTEGQKVMAAVDLSDNDESARISKYLVVNAPVDEDDIEEAEYNMNRDYIIDEVEDAIDAYMTASTTAKKDAAKTTLAELILSIDNTANEYGSDIAYVLGNLATGIYTPYDADEDDADEETAPSYDEFGTDDEFEMEASSLIYTVIAEGATDENIVSFQIIADDDDEDLLYVTFGYELFTTADDDEFDNDDYADLDSYMKTGSVINNKYDGYLSDWIVDYDKYEDAVDAIEDAIKDDESLIQKLIDDLSDAISDMEGEYADLITYQLSLKDVDGSTKVSKLHSNAQEYEEELVSRWDAYIALIEAYGFEDSYIDNANQEDLAATFYAMYMLLGYDFENNVLAADFTDEAGYEKTLSNVLFFKEADMYDEGEKFYTPNLFVDGVLAASESMMQVALAVQSETDAVKQDIINYVVSTGYYTSDINVGDADATYVAALYYAATFYGGYGTELSYVGYTYSESDGYTFVPVSYSTTAEEYTNLSTEAKLETTYTLLDITINTAKNLEDIQAWIDYQVLAQALYEDSDFYSDLEKKGLDTAMTEMFEDITEAAKDRIDEMDADITEYGSLSYTVATSAIVSTFSVNGDETLVWVDGAPTWMATEDIDNEGSVYDTACLDPSDYTVTVTGINSITKTIDVTTVYAADAAELSRAAGALIALEIPGLATTGYKYAINGTYYTDTDKVITVDGVSYFMLYATALPTGTEPHVLTVETGTETWTINLTAYKLAE